MRLHHFVATSSAVLLAWLGASYLHPMPVKRSTAATPLAADAPVAADPQISGLVVSDSP